MLKLFVKLSREAWELIIEAALRLLQLLIQKNNGHDSDSEA